MPNVAVIQEAPVYLDKVNTIIKACELVKIAASEGAELIVFSEAFIPGYPAWIWRLRPGGDWGLCEETHALLLKNAVNIDSNDLQPLMECAKQNQVTIVCGMNERDNGTSRSTLFNSLVTIGTEGKIINHHRKLMPTNPERMTWGFGDATGLKVVDTPVGRIGGLICWESYMPLARYTLYSQGIEIYIAPTYDSGDDWISSMQHIAREGRCWVINSGCAIQRADLPDDFPEKERLYSEDEDWVNPGDSTVIAPGGEIVAGPMRQEKGILYCDIDSEKSATSKRALDVAGHYSRPDIFTLKVNNKAQKSIKFED